jgi:predicted CoA-binding protein
MGQKVAILGASKNPERYSHRAFSMLKDYGHSPLPVNPGFSELEGVPVFAKLTDIKDPVDTLTMYVGPDISAKLKNEILQLKPKRVIFNPGSENPALEKDLEKAGIHIVDACTLVLLRTNQFEKA